MENIEETFDIDKNKVSRRFCNRQQIFFLFFLLKKNHFYLKFKEVKEQINVIETDNRKRASYGNRYHRLEK